MENKNVVKIPKIKKNISRNIIIFIFLTIIILAITGFFLSRRLVPYMIIEYDGYAVSGEEITQILLGSEVKDDKNRNISAIKVKDQMSIYKDRKDLYYLGESRKDNLNIEYPIYVNDNISLYNMSNNVTLVTNSYKEVSGYANSTLVSGNLYNMSDLNRADYNDYIFFKNERGIFVNAFDIMIKTESNSYKIPMNSILAFYEDYILYYTLLNDVFIYNEILDLDLKSEIKIGDLETITYKEFLNKAKIANVQEEKKLEIEEESIIVEQDVKKEEIKKNKEEKIEDVEKKDEKVEEEKIEDERIEENIEEINETPLQENIEIVDIPVITYVTPEVTVKNVTSEVYKINFLINIYDPTHQITTPITFTIKHNNKVYMRKSFTSSGIGNISGLLPEEDYSIEAEYVYLNEEEESIKREILNEQFSTKSIKELNPITLGFEYGNIISDGLNLKDLKIISDILLQLDLQMHIIEKVLMHFMHRN